MINPFGPLFPFELARVVRRQRPIMGRCLYALLLTVLLGFVYLSLFPHAPSSLWDFLFRPTADAKQMAMFGYMFFVIFALVQFSTGTLAVAGSASSILAEEKERQTLPFLLTTTLSDREIVLGKLAARFAQIAMVLLAGLPVLALMQVMGGVDPTLLWVLFVATAASMLSAAGIGAAASITANTAKQANKRTALCIVGYLAIVPALCSFFANRFPTLRLVPAGLGTFTMVDLVDWINAGNFFYAFGIIGNKLTKGGHIDHIIGPILSRFLIFHGAVALLTTTWASLRLRRVMAKQSDQAINKAVKTSPFMAKGGRKPVSETRPVWWRETSTAIGKANQRRFVKWFARLGFLLSFAPLGVVIIVGLITGNNNRLGEGVHMLVRAYGTMVLCGTLLHIGNSASNMIGRERKQQTMDELFLTDLDNREILDQKCWASIWSVRWAWVWLGVYWLADLLTGGMMWFTPLLLLAFYALFVWVAVRVGMAAAVYESPRFKPAGVTALILLALAGLPMILPIVHALFLEGVIGDTKDVMAFATGMSPPAVLAIACFGTDDMSSLQSELGSNAVTCFAAGLILGIGIWLAVGIFARRRMLARFAMDRRE